jgi:hypothetical protein
VKAGQIFHHADFYLSRETGEWEPKYLVVLARTPGDDIVARLLTSRAHGRPENPPCYHGDPYPGFYLGVLGGPLGAKSWVDLRALPDLDVADFERKLKQQRASFITELSREVLQPLMDCVARADDTTRLQERSIRDTLASLQ